MRGLRSLLNGSGPFVLFSGLQGPRGMAQSLNAGLMAFR